VQFDGVIDDPTQDQIAEVLAALRRDGLEGLSSTAEVGGGSISRTLRLDGDSGPVLLKLEVAEREDMLRAETESLAALRRTGAVAVPAVLACGTAGGRAYLALEWVDFGAKTQQAERNLGRALVDLHRSTAADFGWHRDNYIGRTPQPNERREDWSRFLRDMRLGPQLELARRNGFPREAATLGARLLDDLEQLLEGHSPAPSLLHGDLWGGNWGATRDGTPYLYDPAVYFGDREADLAMTRLFGGFGPDFYRAYEREWPLPAGWELRVELYNLYHVLNHFNLFGGTYASQAAGSLRRLVSLRR
jgi:protein-ribulosamine 3-kinase